MINNDKQMVLIVDDFPKNLQVLGSVLKKEGYRVAFAKSGEDALKYIYNNQPDLILLDVMMPGMDGYEVCKKLKDDEKTMDIPIIFITALSNADDEYKGFELGGVDYITKPFHQKIVKARIKSHLRLKRKTELLDKLSSIDGLTDLFNRRKFDETLEKEWSRSMRNSKPLSLIMIDIDYFKQYNDHYGHAFGDECLQSVASSLKNSIKRPADFVARYGGEEFVVILPETDNKGGIEVAESIRQNIELLEIPHEKSQVSDHVTISLGIATTIPQKGSNQNKIIQTADKCLYKSKEKGRNQVSGYTLIDY